MDFEDEQRFFSPSPVLRLMEREAPVTDNIKAEVADSYREVVCSGVAALGGVSTLLIHAPNCFFKGSLSSKG